MANALGETLVAQFRTARALLDHHLAGLSTEELHWHPAARVLAMRPSGEGSGWIPDWPEHETYAIGPPTAGWTTWHLGYWLSTAQDRNFGTGELTRDDIRWPADGAGTAEWIARLCDEWLAKFESLDDCALSEPMRSRWPYTDRTLAAVLAWSTVELTKNAAELGMARFMFAVRGTQTSPFASLPSSTK